MKFNPWSVASSFSSLAALTVFASPAGARQQHGLDLKFRVVGQQQWHENLEVSAGAVVEVGVQMTIPEQYWGLAAAKYNIASVGSGWDIDGNDRVDFIPGKGSSTDGRLAGFDFGGQTQVAFEQPGALRIDADRDDGNWSGAGISTHQNIPEVLGTNFASIKKAIVYKFAVRLHDMPIERTITLRIADGLEHGDVNEITSFKVYETQQSFVGTSVDGFSGDTGSITVVPSPASVCLAMIAGGCVRMRRRRD